ncbi:FAD-dependent oxidoreductase [Nocardia sp. NPDC050630]|uniref:FAD-dependent oxidoreductase n=1 Tax=Nocardia sp. NPDC050630 TaxID=3364321 RepID=UPI0037AD2EE3
MSVDRTPPLAPPLDRTHRIAIVGSGPSGFYAASELLARTGAEIDMFDRLLTPFGLVRAGVAPDHPKIKTVTRVFDKTAQHPRFRFIGNVSVGQDITPNTLAKHYTAVIYAHGASKGRTLDISDARLPGNHTATELVGWYNGHPDRSRLEVDLSGERAVVIGNGNVAIDIARMLATGTDELATTDIADHALAALRDSRIREIVVLGRRGPEHAAFTHPELLELGQMSAAGVQVLTSDLGDVLTNAAQTHDLSRTLILETLYRYATNDAPHAGKRIVLRFHSTPVEIIGDERVEAIRITHPATDASAPNSIVTQTLPTGLVVHAIGYTGSPIDGLPFDNERGIVPNDKGRVHAADDPFAGIYTTGWIKRGPNGIIGTNRLCAKETVETLLDDLETGRLRPRHTSAIDIDTTIASAAPRHTYYEDWKHIDAEECRRGAARNRPRIKLTDHEEMLAVATRHRAPHELTSSEI